MQAVLITAYHKFDQLKKLSELLSRKFEVYIHIDQKVRHEFTPANGMIHVFSAYPVNWGSCSHLKAILLLMSEALKDPETTYCHLISGDDWPVRSLEEICDHFEHTDEIDMLCTKFSQWTPEWYEICHEWQQYYHYLDTFNRQSLPGKAFLKLFLGAQRILRVNRYPQVGKIIGKDAELAQGLVWGSYPRDAVEYCFQYHREHPELMEFLGKGQAAEEYFFQTILANVPAFEKRITNHHYRYMNWTKKNGTYPGTLDSEDFKAIRDGQWHFCRKVDAEISGELLKMLDETYQIRKF